MTSSIMERKLQPEIQTLPPNTSKGHVRIGRAPTKPSNQSTHTPIPKPTDKKKDPVATPSLVQTFSSEWAANRASAVLPASLLVQTHSWLLFWSKLIGFIFQLDTAVMLPTLTVEFTK